MLLLGTKQGWRPSKRKRRNFIPFLFSHCVSLPHYLLRTLLLIFRPLLPYTLPLISTSTSASLLLLLSSNFSFYLFFSSFSTSFILHLLHSTYPYSSCTSRSLKVSFLLLHLLRLLLLLLYFLHQQVISFSFYSFSSSFAVLCHIFP